jgi:dTDP-4-dehydrorhamnose reductase
VVKVLILGSTGMLGNAVGKHFLNNSNYETYLTYRNSDVSYGNNKQHFDALRDPLGDLPDVDYVINCIGVIKPNINKSHANSVKINSLFPHQLAEYCEKTNKKLIHITTDCVFSGKDGNYNEQSLHDCLDFYGKSKSIGEPTNCMTIRTSIIGEEIHNNSSLIEWAKSMKGEAINGFTNHFWNGVTTNEYARLCDVIISNDYYEKGLFHVHSNSVNKFELLTLLSNKFNLGLNITPYEFHTFCDRTMSSVKELNSKLKVKTIQEQIIDI